jgi:segregation and condensation protein A
MLKRFEKREESTRDIFEDKWTVSEKIEYVVRLLASRESVRFSELFEDATSRSEVVCTFLALLELIRLKQLLCAQSEDFGEIEIKKRAAAVAVPNAPEAAASDESHVANAADSQS